MAGFAEREDQLLPHMREAAIDHVLTIRVDCNDKARSQRGWTFNAQKDESNTECDLDSYPFSLRFDNSRNGREGDVIEHMRRWCNLVLPPILNDPAAMLPAVLFPLPASPSSSPSSSLSSRENDGLEGKEGQEGKEGREGREGREEEGQKEGKGTDGSEGHKAAQETLTKRREEIAGIVCGALESWCNVVPSKVNIELACPWKDFIFKVFAASASPPASPPVVIIKFGSKGDTLSDRRTDAATAHYEAYGICPRRLAQGDGWWIEEDGGPMLFDVKNGGAHGDGSDGFDAHNAAHRASALSGAVEYGRLLGKIHATPTDWFKPFFEEDAARFPFLRTLPDAGSFLWLYQNWDAFAVSMAQHSADPHRLQRLTALLEALPTPRCPALARLTTSHGDCWFANVLWNPKGGGLLACDTESSCVMRGIYDWMHCQTLWHTREQQAISKIGSDAPAYDHLVRAMVTSYLVQLGEPAAEEDVDVALFDMRSFYLGGMYIRDGCDQIMSGPLLDPYGEEAPEGINDVDTAYDNAMFNIGKWKQRMQAIWNHPEQRKAFVGPGWDPSNHTESERAGGFWAKREDWEPKYLEL